MTDGPQASAGWYPDAQGELRYWDGGAWTEHTASKYRATQQSAETTIAPTAFHSATKPRKPWTRRWQFWVVLIVVLFMGIGAVGNATTPDPVDDSKVQATKETNPIQATAEPTPSEEPTTEAPVVLLFITDQKDGDSWVASDGEEYRLGLINTPETNEQCGAQATAFTRTFLSDGFTVDAYTTDVHGRQVAEVFDKDGTSLNVALAKSGLGDDRYLEEFRHENPDLGHRLDVALRSAAKPTCRKPVAPVPLVKKADKTSAPAKKCMSGYTPCLPIVADLDCGEIGHPVAVTGSDPYRLDRDGDGTGCD
jgi:endonuclease YncB( thermonuclease family)